MPRDGVVWHAFCQIGQLRRPVPPCTDFVKTDERRQSVEFGVPVQTATRVNDRPVSQKPAPSSQRLGMRVVTTAIPVDSCGEP
jgi:hypothetical protein